MSETEDPDLDAIRRIDLAEDDRGVVDLLADDCVYHEDPHWLDGRVVEGRDAIAAVLAEYREILGTRDQAIEHAGRIGGGIVMTVRQAGSSPQGAVPFEQFWTFALQMNHGKIKGMWAFRDPEAARAKAAELD